MPSSPLFLHSGLGVIAAIVSLTLIASVLTLVASTFLLWRYRRTVARLMSARVGEGERQATSDAESDRPACSNAVEPDWVALSRASLPADRLYHRVIFEPRRVARRYALAGVLFALLLGLASFFAFSQTQVNYLRAGSHPLQCLFLFWTFAWPIVLTTNVVAGVSAHRQWLNVLIYFVVLVALGGLLALTPTEASPETANLGLPGWSGETPTRLVAKWGLFNVAPTLLTLAFRNRRVRAVAPLVLSFMSIVSAGLLGVIAAAFAYQELSVRAVASASEALGVSVRAALIGYFLLLGTVGCLLSGALGWRLLVWMRSGYQRGTVSDQSLAIDALWLLFASFYAVILAFAGPGWALSALLAFFIYKIAVGVGNKRGASKGDLDDCAPALLVLRVFALGKRSEILFDAVTKHWRYVGNVRLIAGADLAVSTVAPHQFLAFVRGKLSQLFINSEAAINSSLAALDVGRDADGRFRINEFFCRADTWQGALRKLTKSTDAVLMDLRAFTENNAGCVFEIKELLATMSLERVVFVVDDTTDKEFLEKAVREACRELRSDSPNVGLTLSAVRPFQLNSHEYGTPQGLLQQICAAAGFRDPGVSPS